VDEITGGEGAYAGIDPVAKDSTGMVSASVVANALSVCIVPLLQIERWTISNVGRAPTWASTLWLRTPPARWASSDGHLLQNRTKHSVLSMSS